MALFIPIDENLIILGKCNCLIINVNHSKNYKEDKRNKRPYN